MKRYVYLAGPILGCNKSEANDWRTEMCSRLAEYNLVGISPLRCEPLVGERYGMEYTDPMFGTARAIANKNMMDVKMCDVTLAYFPKRAEWGRSRNMAGQFVCDSPKEPSAGTLIEIAWAHAFGRPVIVVSEDDFITKHPVVNACAGWMLKDLDQATELILGLLLDYSA